MSSSAHARTLPSGCARSQTAGVPVVYDSVGKSTLQASLDPVCKFEELLVSNGTSSGPVDRHHAVGVKGSLWVTRPAMVHYATPRAKMLAMAAELFDHVLAGRITGGRKIRAGGYRQCARALESRRGWCRRVDSMIGCIGASATTATTSIFTAASRGLLSP